MGNEPRPTIAPGWGGNALHSGGYGQAGQCDAGCDVCGCGAGVCASSWYVSADGLFMTRNQPNKVYTSAEATSFGNSGYFDDMNWTWGGQGTLGYRFGGGPWAVEGTYWGVLKSNTDGGPGIPGPYVSPMIFGLTSILGTTGGLPTTTNPNSIGTADQWTDSSPNHHIWRNWQTQDVEINLSRTLCDGNCNRFSVDFLAGARWLRFQDGFLFGAQRNLTDGSIYAGDWLYLNDRVTNDLLGFQAGFNADFRFAPRWKVFVKPLVGVFDNHMTLNYNLYAVSSATGNQYQASSQTFTSPNYPVHATSDGLALLTQVDLGVDWQITRHIGTQIGYRVVAVTGTALSDSQIPFYGNDTQAIADIKHDDSLLLHGAFGGVTVTW
jgi:hypothetical protein